MTRLNTKEWHPSHVVSEEEEYRHVYPHQWNRYIISFYPDGSATSKIMETNISEEEYFKRKLAGTL